MNQPGIEKTGSNAVTPKLVCQFPNPSRFWLQSRLDTLSNQLYDVIDGLEGIICYDYSQTDVLYAEYRLSGYSARQIECFLEKVGYNLHQLIDSYRHIELPPRLLFVKSHRITIQAPKNRRSDARTFKA